MQRGQYFRIKSLTETIFGATLSRPFVHYASFEFFLDNETITFKVPNTYEPKVTLLTLLDFASEYISLFVLTTPLLTITNILKNLHAMKYGRLRFSVDHMSVFGLCYNFAQCYDKSNCTQTWNDPYDILLNHINIECICDIIWQYNCDLVELTKSLEYCPKEDCIFRQISSINLVIDKNLHEEQYQNLSLPKRIPSLKQVHLVFDPLGCKNSKDTLINNLQEKVLASKTCCHIVKLVTPPLIVVHMSWQQKQVDFATVYLYNSMQQTMQNLWDKPFVLTDHFIKLNILNTRPTQTFAIWVVNLHGLHKEWTSLFQYRPIGIENEQLVLPILLRHSKRVVKKNFCSCFEQFLSMCYTMNKPIQLETCEDNNLCKFWQRLQYAVAIGQEPYLYGIKPIEPQEAWS